MIFFVYLVKYKSYKEHHFKQNIDGKHLGHPQLRVRRDQNFGSDRLGGADPIRSAGQLVNQYIP